MGDMKRWKVLALLENAQQRLIIEHALRGLLLGTEPQQPASSCEQMCRPKKTSGSEPLHMQKTFLILYKHS
jgi:hypothetical protein